MYIEVHVYLILLLSGNLIMNKLISIGCSYTEHYIHTETKLDFPRWPELLADKLDMDCVNLGKRGMGQEYMVAQLLDTLIAEKNISLVVIMWSEWQRMDFKFRSGKGTDGWVAIHPHRDNSKIERYPINREGRLALLEHNNVLAATMRSLRFFLIAQKLLKDIPYLMLQGCNPFNLQDETDEVNWEEVTKIRKQAIGQMLDSPITDEIYEDKFIGWPVINRIGGYCADNILDKLDPDRIKLRVSGNDTHPNGDGHKVISDHIYNTYKKIY